MTVFPPQSAPLTGQTAWIFSDGKAGHDSQCLGVVEALGLVPEIKSVRLTGLHRWLAPWGPVPARDAFGKPGSRFAPPWPAFAFATGRTTIPYVRALRRQAGLATFTVILMDPHAGTQCADLIWVPEHDQLRGANVIHTLAAPHRFSARRIAALRAKLPPDIAVLPHPRVACLIGGPNGDYRFADGDQRKLEEVLKALNETGAGLMITTSRRTPLRLASALKGAVRGRNVLFWDGAGQNPYPDFLAHADRFLITADSISMICEAAATGRPIHLFTPTGGSAKFRRFHAALAAHGVTRPVPAEGAPLENWTYTPLFAAEEIAAEIARRWQRRAELLPSLVQPGGRAKEL